MGMQLLEETFQIYVQMRSSGKDAKATLAALRTRIETLQPNDRAEMVRRVKVWESHRPAAAPEKPIIQPPPPPAIKPPPPRAEKTVICPRCGKSNHATEVFCVHCGNFLRTDVNPNETTKLADPEGLSRGPDFFGPESSLVLVVIPGNYSYTIQPQRYKHETVIGRSEGSTMKPDIDLSVHNAGEMGVSRLHVALQYNAKNNLLSVSDMKSANGTFINGQKLYPQEVRVLRDGDELRLGRLVLRAYFQHQDAKAT